MPTITKVQTYALIINGEFACQYKHPSEGPAGAERITAILQSDPKIILAEGMPDEYGINTYNLLIENETVGQIFYHTDPSIVVNPEMINAALQSDPTIVDITDIDPQPQVGWLWDGNTFTNPGG